MNIVIACLIVLCLINLIILNMNVKAVWTLMYNYWRFRK